MTYSEQDITVQDRVKRLYQRAFGGGHMVYDAASSLARLQEECQALLPAAWDEPLFEPLGHGHCRMHLRPLLATGLSLQTANALFVFSANRAQPDLDFFSARLDDLTATATPDERQWLAAYRREGCPALSHSRAYRERFAPAYRVVDEAFIAAFPLVRAIDACPSGVFAIDGPCASGKTTLARLLGDALNIPVLHTDDFFLRPRQRTAKRLAEPGGNFDRERFAQEILAPLLRGQGIAYRPFDCATGRLLPKVTLPPAPRALIEGAYSHHPALADAYAVRAFVKTSPEEQLHRLAARNPSLLPRFTGEWIPMENLYFSTFGIEAGSDIVITT